MKYKKIIYYKDELNDEFSEVKIHPRVIDENYTYIHRNLLWNIASFATQNILSIPLKLIYPKIKFRIKYIGKDKLKPYKGKSYFIYANHTQPLADTMIPSNYVYPKRNFFIVNPENISMKGMKTLVELLGAIPIPGNKEATKKFLEALKDKVNKKYVITIYPEAHIWPYYTKIRPFKSVSFKYPVRWNTPIFCITNTYQSYGKNGDKIQIVSYLDGPFFAESGLNAKEQQNNIRDKIYDCMVERSKKSNIEYIKYQYIQNN